MLKCIAIDDEPLALTVIENYCKQIPSLDLVKTFLSPFEALETLQNGKIDLLFLDIRMPDISGIQFLNGLKDKPMVIFTTAYKEYAVESYELEVIDYLLKPISLERFLKAVNRAQEIADLRKGNGTNESETLRIEEDDYIFVNSEYKLIRINIHEILFIEGLKDYIKIYTTSSERPILTIMRIKTFEEKLPAAHFMRVHRSFIINIHKIDYIKKTRITIGKHEIPVGDNYSEAFYKVIENKNWK